jgi:hypothetical protein
MKSLADLLEIDARPLLRSRSMLSNILVVLTPVIIGLAAAFITERLLRKLALGRASADQRWRSTL